MKGKMKRKMEEWKIEKKEKKILSNPKSFGDCWEGITYYIAVNEKGERKTFHRHWSSSEWFDYCPRHGIYQSCIDCSDRNTNPKNPCRCSYGILIEDVDGYVEVYEK